MMRRNTFQFIKKYSLLYSLILLPIVISAFAFGKGLLWGPDCYLQHYPALVYTARAVRRLFAGGGFRMFDLSLGQGLDTITTLSYYGLFDPLSWPAALFSDSWIVVWYHVRMLLYIYLAGIAFCLYLKELSLPVANDSWTLALSGLIYISSAYMIIGTFRHPFFATGMLFLPLELFGVERIRSSRGFLPMTLTTAAMLIVNFYFAYQVTCITICYILVRIIFDLKEKGLKRSAEEGVVLLAAYILGAFLSAAVLFPTVLAFLRSTRSSEISGYAESLLYYPMEYYLKLVFTYVAPYDYAGFWSIQCFSPFVLLSVAALLDRNEKCRAVKELRAGFILGILFLCVPLFGKIMNGMGYVTNRWCYAFAWMNSLISAWAIPKIFRSGSRLSRIRIGFIFSYGIIMLFYALMICGFQINVQENAGILIGGISVVATAIVYTVSGRPSFDPVNRRRLLSLSIIVFCFVYSIGYGVAAAWDTNYNSLYLYDEMRDAVTLNDEETDIARIDYGIEPGARSVINESYPTGFYWSLIPDTMCEYARDLELSTLCWTFRLQGLSGDPWINEAACVGKSVRSSNSNLRAVIPAGYANAGEYSGIIMYENQNVLPFGVIFKESISKEAWKELDSFEKRQALLQYAIIDSKNDSDAPAMTDFTAPEAIPFDISIDSGKAELIQSSDGTVKGIIGQRGAILRCSFDAPADSALFLRFRAPVVKSTSGEVNFVMQTNVNDGYGEIFFIRKDGNFNFTQNNITAYLGDTCNETTECLLRLREDVDLSFAAMELYVLPLSAYRDPVDSILSASSGWRPEIRTNGFSGSISAKEDGILQISLPFLEGWKATVDGKTVPLFQCGGMYTGLQLDKGTHHIELSYCTPGLKTGALISFISLLFIAALPLARHYRKMPQRKEY